PRRNDLRGTRDRRELVETRIGHRHLADIGLDGAERIIGRLRRRGLGERIEKRRLADIGQTDDAAFETHNYSDSFAPGSMPLAWSARCTLFWKVASWPVASSATLAAIASTSASTQTRSSLEKSCST